MNVLQEVILDRLIGAPGDDFAPNSGGPLAVAFRALLDAHLIERGAPDAALGYPMMFATGLQGACSMFKEVEEQRQLAVAVFTTISPSAEPVELTPRQQIESALWCARHSHPLICRPECPFMKDATGQIVRYLDRGKARGPHLRPSNPRFNECSASNEIVWDSIEMSSVTLRCMGYYTIEKVLDAAKADRAGETPELAACFASGYAGRLAALLSGVAGATEFCFAFARELEMI
jgi:hypothetical protein